MTVKKDKQSIIRKREWKLNAIMLANKVKLETKRRLLAQKYHTIQNREIEKVERKLNAYYNKKKLEYDRKCKNEIRKLEGKEERVYKKKEKKVNIRQFVMELMQENAKLRDTDRSGNGFCVSCDLFKERWQLAWGHRYSRRVKNICTLPENINAQCHTCNFTTWPRWDFVAKEKVNRKYDENLDKRWWEWTSTRLRELNDAYFKNVNGTTYGLITSDELIEDAIKENELRWKLKDFYRPKKKWREIRNKIKEQH